MHRSSLVGSALVAALVLIGLVRLYDLYCRTPHQGIVSFPTKNDAFSSHYASTNATTPSSPSCQLDCRVTNTTLPPFQQHKKLTCSGGGGTTTACVPARIIFLLGLPHTGTSAGHFLISTSGNVSTLRGGPNRPTMVSPTEEGWSLLKIKQTHPDSQRWDGKLDFLNWTDVAVNYGRRWDLTRPILLENSPPEIQVPEKLKAAFEPMYGKVKFILLVRGGCTCSGGWNELVTMDRYKTVVDQFPEDTFVMRFEDLCLRWEQVASDLAQWEPLLSDVNISAIPGMRNRRHLERAHHSHSQTSVQEYCEHVVHKWGTELPPRPQMNTAPSQEGRPYFVPRQGEDNALSKQALAFFGYDKTNTC